MRVAIDTSPLSSGHKVRGVGFYLTHLLEALRKFHPEHEYLSFQKSRDIPPSVDVVHYPYFEPFFLTLPLRYSYPTVITIHDLTPLKFPQLFPVGAKGALKWQIQKILVKGAAAIITDSENSKKDIHQIIGVPDSKIQVAHLAAATHFIKKPLGKKDKEEMRLKYSLPDVFLLYVGDVTPNKNLPVLLQAVTRLNLPLVMVGKSLSNKEFDRSNPWNKDLVFVQEMARTSPLIHILGFVPDGDLVSLYTMAEVFVMPSFYEGFGLPLLEAMSCGTPCVTTKEASLPEIGGDAVLYANYSDPSDFAEKIQRVITKASLAASLSQKGLEQAAKFSWEKTAQETVAVYERVVKT